jgi:hypothetical protein
LLQLCIRHIKLWNGGLITSGSAQLAISTISVYRFERSLFSTRTTFIIQHQKIKPLTPVLSHTRQLFTQWRWCRRRLKAMHVLLLHIISLCSCNQIMYRKKTVNGVNTACFIHNILFYNNSPNTLSLHKVPSEEFYLLWYFSDSDRQHNKHFKINQSNCSRWVYLIIATCFDPYFGPSSGRFIKNASHYWNILLWIHITVNHYNTYNYY